MQKQVLKTLIAGGMLVMMNTSADAQSWSLSGNAGTANANFIGTTDSKDFRIRTNGTTRITVKSIGKTGFGTSSPVAKLHVFSSTLVPVSLSADGLFVIGDKAGYNIAFDAQDVQARNNSAAATLYQNFYGGDVQLGSSTSPFIYKYSNGNAGIGTLSPACRLQISGSDSSNQGKNAAIEISNTAIGGTNWYLKSGATGTTTPKGGFSIANDNSHYFVIDSGGQVAINTTTPATGYRLSVNGKIICEELGLQVKTDWPDYVFDKTYSLKSLPEIKAFIETNNHLPEVPSAREIKSKGVAVGEMQAILLKKIEELTLYVIAQDEKISQMQKQLNEVAK
ncbi:MAG: hypothetical protein ABI723_09590 [Bacteroidia bacterium]